MLNRSCGRHRRFVRRVSGTGDAAPEGGHRDPPLVSDEYMRGAERQHLLVLGVLCLGLAVIGLLFIASMPGGAL